MRQIIVGVVFVSLLTPVIAWLVGRWADREQARQAEERRRLDRIMAASQPPMAPGLRSSHRKVS